MEDNRLFENWEESRQRLHTEYPHLAPEDTEYKVGEEEAILEKLQIKLNKTKKEITDWLGIMG